VGEDVTIILGTTSSDSSDNSSLQTTESTPETISTSVQTETTVTTTEVATVATSETSESETSNVTETEIKQSAVDDVDFTFYSEVRNDVTGNWRCAVCYTSKTFDEYAVEYYNTYFNDDSELHFVVNLGLKTTSVVRYISGQLNVNTYEYVDGEEHDAKLLASGQFYNQYYIDLETGEKEIVE
jgi:hypothetical protein